MADDADRMAEVEQRAAEQFAAALREQRQRPAALRCVDCGGGLEPHRQPYGRCLPCATRLEQPRWGVR